MQQQSQQTEMSTSLIIIDIFPSPVAYSVHHWNGLKLYTYTTETCQLHTWPQTRS